MKGTAGCWTMGSPRGSTAAVGAGWTPYAAPLPGDPHPWWEAGWMYMGWGGPTVLLCPGGESEQPKAASSPPPRPRSAPLLLLLWLIIS